MFFDHITIGQNRADFGTGQTGVKKGKKANLKAQLKEYRYLPQQGAALMGQEP